MDIHKPKAWHSFREFLKEYLIIVVGVLTALTAEAGVEWLHWRNVVAEERAALNANLQRNDRAMRYRLWIEPCVQSRLADLDEIFRRHARGEPLRIIGRIGRPSYILGNTRAWDLTVADGSLAHMPLDEKGRYMSAFTVWGSYYDTHLEERADWRDLQGLDHADELSAADWSALRRVAERARDDDLSMHSGLAKAEWLSPIDRLGLKALPWPKTPRLQPQLAAFCRPMIER
jgi:hypothetical protein